MSKIKEQTYFLVQAWMVTKLELRTVERDCYAIIYGYSQDGESNYHGSLSYMAELTGYSRQSICTALKSLTEKKFILKEEFEISGIKVCKYKANLQYVSSFNGGQAALPPVQAACTNNITNNITKKVLSKDNTTESGFEFGKPKEVKLNVYQQCISIIDSYTSEPKINKLLKEYLDYLLKKSQAENKVFYVNQFKGIINTLIKLVAEGNNAQNVIEQSINKGYVGFYPTNSGRCFTDNIQTPQRKSSPHNRARDKNGNLMEF